jgi:hypothetical protein
MCLYIVTSVRLSTGLLETSLPIIISFKVKITHFVIYFIYLLINYFLIFLFVRYLLLIIRLGRFLKPWNNGQVPDVRLAIQH